MGQRTRHTLVAAAVALTLAAARARACSVPTFVTGKGLPYHTYLVPHPATLLIYADPEERFGRSDEEALYSGLQAAGHTVTVVRDREALRSALGRDHYDLVITPFGPNGEVAGQVSADAPTAAVLPVVEKSQRDAPALQKRFAHYVVDGAGVGSYLRTIDRTLAKPRT